MFGRAELVTFCAPGNVIVATPGAFVTGVHAIGSVPGAVVTGFSRAGK